MNSEELASETSRRVLAGLKWTALVRVFAQMISWVMSIVVIHYIKPEDYGLKSMAEISLALLNMLSSGGIESAIIYSKNLNTERISKIFGLLILINFLLFTIQIFGAYPLSTFYNEPKVLLVAQIMAMGFLLVPFSSIPSALLSREMDFKLLSTVALVANLVGASIVLSLAILGYGVWALIAGPLVTQLLQAIILNIYKPCLPRPSFSLSGVKDMAGFGGTIILAGLLWMVYSKADIFIAGHFMTAHDVGLYSVAFYLASLPIDKIMPILHQVAFPAYARLRDYHEVVAKYFLKAARLTSLLLLPLSFGLAGIAEYIVPLVLGDEWKDLIPVLILLCIVFPVRGIVSLCANMTSAIGRPRINLQYGFLASITMIPAFIASVQYGIWGLGLVWLLVFPWIMFVNVLSSIHVIKVPFRSYLRAVIPPFILSTLMLVGLLCFTSTGTLFYNSWITLFIMMCGGAFVYIGGMYVLSKDRLVELYNMRK
jgi:O-antigen/teichoic acid export membrane protein